jgi:tetratricopeptide (TPR) repeat protein
MPKINIASVTLGAIILIFAGCASGPSDKEKLLGYIERGDMYYDVGDLDNYQKAEDQYRRALALDPKHPRVLIKLGNIYFIYSQNYFIFKDIKMAEDYLNYSYNCFNEAIKYEPENPEPYFGLYKVYYTKGRYGDGIQAIQKLMSLPTIDIIVQGDCLKALGRLYKEQEKYSEALKEYKKYLEILPEAQDADSIRLIIKTLEKGIAPNQEKKQ